MTTEARIPQTERIGERDSRQLKAEVLFERAVFERVSIRGEVPEVWRIHTPKGTVYDMEIDRQICQCRDYEQHWHLHEFRCKHLVALAKKREWSKKNARELVGFGVVGGDAA